MSDRLSLQTLERYRPLDLGGPREPEADDYGFGSERYWLSRPRDESEDDGHPAAGCVGTVVGVLACAFGLMGPTLLPLHVYVAVLVALPVGAAVWWRWKASSR